MEFKSKYNIDELVEVEPQRPNANENEFGFVVSIKFYKSDAVNYSASYTLHLANSEEVLHEVPESEILKSYGNRR